MDYPDVPCNGCTRMTAADIDRFWRFVERLSPDECWPWMGKRHKFGYGEFTVCQNGKRKVLRGHRIALEIATGQPLGALQALHSCDNPSCCNPRHLSGGTHAKNMADMVMRGRAYHPPRKLLCPRGHAYAETGRMKQCAGGRLQQCCRACESVYNKRTWPVRKLATRASV